MFKWNDSYSCNVEQIDEQHMKLFEIGSRIFSAASVNDGYDHYDEIMQILDELMEYTSYHFKYEEDLFTRYNYPQSETHIMEHNFFVKKLQRIARHDLEDEQHKAMLDIVNFVADWITEHILKSDFEYRDYLHGKGVK